MAKFNFRLQKYLGLKEKLEEQKRIEFGNAAKALEEEKAKLKALENERGAAVANLKKEVERGIDPRTWQVWNRYIEFIKKRIEAQKLAVAAAEEFLEVKRLELVESMRERKTIEVLRDKRKEEYFIEEKKAEQKLLDELVSARKKLVIRNY